MKHAVFFFSLIFSLNALPFNINAALNAEVSNCIAKQSAITGSDKLKSNKRHYNYFRIWNKKKAIFNKLNPHNDSNGKLAIMLLLLSFAMLILPTALLIFALVVYLTSLLFAILGLLKDKHKAYSIFALVFALIPILLLIAFFIGCKNCFD